MWTFDGEEWTNGGAELRIVPPAEDNQRMRELYDEFHSQTQLQVVEIVPVTREGNNPPPPFP